MGVTDHSSSETEITNNPNEYIKNIDIYPSEAVVVVVAYQKRKREREKKKKAKSKEYMSDVVSAYEKEVFSMSLERRKEEKDLML